MGVHEGPGQVAVVHPKQIREDNLLNLAERLVNDLYAATARALVAELQLCELWKHSPLDHAPDRLDRGLQLATIR